MINVTQTFLPPFEEYEKYLRRVWDSKWLTNRGELVRELEEKLNSFLGVKNLLLVSNGTIALQIAIKALELKGEIITTPFSYVATVSSIVWENCTPVFVDIDKDYLTIDETKIEAAITEKTSAILATHVYGNPCNVEAIQAIAEKHNLKVIYDAAHCFGVKYKGESILNWGDISTLSFHATKLFHTGEGGAVVCRDKQLADKVFYHHNFGHKGHEDFYGLGVNGKISEIHAALGLCVLPHIGNLIEKRKELSKFYDLLLSETEITKPVWREETESTYTYYPVIFESESALLQTRKALENKEISSRRYFYPSLNKLPYVSEQSAPVSEKISQRILCLPLYPDLETREVKEICETIIQNLK